MSRLPSVSRAARLIAVGGLTVGVGLGSASVFAATTASPSPSPSPSQKSTSASAPAAAHPGPGKGHGPRGAGGTITQISGSTLTLRTEQGTETITTSSSTTYSKEHQTIAFNQLHTGDIVHVAGTAASTTTTPGTGTWAATAVNVEEPSLGGRVASISGDTLSLVGREGRLFTVQLNGSTRFYSQGTTSTRSAITVGSHVHAEGNQTDLTHLTADAVVLDPPRPA